MNKSRLETHGASADSGECRRNRADELWRSPEQWADPETLRRFVESEFPGWADLLETPVDRRRLLQLMGASLLLGGLGACGRPPKEEIVPYVRQPEQIVPGRPQYFATALTHGGYAQGVVVESHLGRPTKVEGNPSHPASLGATDIFAQAAVLGLYDPDRSAAVTRAGAIADFTAFAREISERSGEWADRQGAGVCILTETFTSPTLARQLADFFRACPEARWVRHDPVGREHVRAGARLAFGREADTLYRFDRAAVVLSLDSDFLTETPARTRYGHDFIAGRRVRADRRAMNRLYALESVPGLAGALADHRLPVRAGEMEAVARALAGRLGIGGVSANDGIPVPERWLDALARDLSAHRGAGAIIAGDHLSPAVHALAQAMNERLGNVGATVLHVDPVAYGPAGEGDSLAALAEDMRAGRVAALLILGGNPAYTAPADLEFAEALGRVPLSIHLGLYADETAALCRWHVPALHELESWTDARAYDGTVSLVQPLIAPLYGGHSVYEVMALLLGKPAVADHEVLQAYWRERRPEPGFDAFWRGALRDGMVPDSANPALGLAVRGGFAATLPPPPAMNPGLEIRFRPDPCIFDGRYANNGWLQELPRPLTKLVWENAVLIGPGTARRLELGNGDPVELVYRGRRLAAPAWIMPGHAEDAATLELGHGRLRAGALGTGTGFDAYQLRCAAAPGFDFGLELRAAGPAGWRNLWPGNGRRELATTQHHGAMGGRDLVKVMALETLPAEPAQPEPLPAMFPDHPYEGHAWAMAIDLNACIGCNACILACQAENNIPIVGREEILRGREMHWLRVDRYHAGAPENPRTYFQPVPCMQCEKAPCEPVCPVQASIHDSEGINNQVYNRCVGTRFCQSNCPYKVRRFNFFEYSANPDTHEGAPIAALLRNPDVTVRSRGVMEKCTYCIQRINAARIRSEQEERTLRDGEIRTACEEACPTRAIVFGDLNSPDSAVAVLKRQPQHYALLAELGTRPRTTYLARLRHPNPEIEDDPEG